MHSGAPAAAASLTTNLRRDAPRQASGAGSAPRQACGARLAAAAGEWLADRRRPPGAMDQATLGRQLWLKRLPSGVIMLPIMSPVRSLLMACWLCCITCRRGRRRRRGESNRRGGRAAVSLRALDTVLAVENMGWTGVPPPRALSFMRKCGHLNPRDCAVQEVALGLSRSNIGARRRFAKQDGARIFAISEQCLPVFGRRVRLKLVDAAQTPNCAKVRENALRRFIGANSRISGLAR
jgi:hypothetical protein